MTKNRDDQKKEVNEILTRSIDTIYPSKDALAKVLSSDKKLTIYVGIDPTATYVHLGHSTNYLLLERFHKLGHKIIVLVGDFTAKIGDPSDKTAARVRLTDEEIANNLKTFKDQIGKILDFNDKDNPIEFKFNSEWLAGLDFEQLTDLASNFTVQQMLERDMFERRLKEQKPLYVHEFFYPLMQGYDSVAMDVDMEVGGTDQTFNMLAGRTLLKRYKDKEKFVIATTLLENPVTGEKLMSKSLGTGVGLDEAPNIMYEKIMRLPDEGIIQCFIDCTRLSLDEISAIEGQIKAGANPRDIKKQLARTIVAMYHSEAEAGSAENYWQQKYTEQIIPDAIEEVSLNGDSDVVSCLVAIGFATSKSDARRLLADNAVKVNQTKVSDSQLEIKSGDIIQVGKKKIAKIS